MDEATPARAGHGTLRILTDGRHAAALLDPDRLRLVEALREAPDSASGLARRLDDSRQRLNYHLRALEEAGLVQLEAERRKGNFRERVFRAAARHFVVDPAAVGSLAADPEDFGDRFSAAYVIALASRAITELAKLWAKAGRERKRLATGALETRVQLARPADFEAFQRDLARAVGRVVKKHHQEGADSRPFRVVLATYPAPADSGAADTRKETENGC